MSNIARAFWRNQNLKPVGQAVEEYLTAQRQKKMQQDYYNALTQINNLNQPSNNGTVQKNNNLYDPKYNSSDVKTKADVMLNFLKNNPGAYKMAQSLNAVNNAQYIRGDDGYYKVGTDVLGQPVKEKTLSIKPKDNIVRVIQDANGNEYGITSTGETKDLGIRGAAKTTVNKPQYKTIGKQILKIEGGKVTPIYTGSKNIDRTYKANDGRIGIIFDDGTHQIIEDSKPPDNQQRSIPGMTDLRKTFRKFKELGAYQNKTEDYGGGDVANYYEFEGKRYSADDYEALINERKKLVEIQMKNMLNLPEEDMTVIDKLLGKGVPPEKILSKAKQALDPDELRRLKIYLEYSQKIR